MDIGDWKTYISHFIMLADHLIPADATHYYEVIILKSEVQLP